MLCGGAAQPEALGVPTARVQRYYSGPGIVTGRCRCSHSWNVAPLEPAIRDFPLHRLQMSADAKTESALQSVATRRFASSSDHRRPLRSGVLCETSLWLDDKRGSDHLDRLLRLAVTTGRRARAPAGYVIDKWVPRDWPSEYALAPSLACGWFLSPFLKSRRRVLTGGPCHSLSFSSHWHPPALLVVAGQQYSSYVAHALPCWWGRSDIADGVYPAGTLVFRRCAAKGVSPRLS